MTPIRTALAFAALAAAACAAGPKPLPADQFAKLHALIRVQPGEQRFWDIPWRLTVGAAREQAAKEGKPIFVWAGAGGAPIGVC